MIYHCIVDTILIYLPQNKPDDKLEPLNCTCNFSCKPVQTYIVGKNYLVLLHKLTVYLVLEIYC